MPTLTYNWESSVVVKILGIMQKYVIL